MMTRRHARRGVLWAGVGVGCAGVLLGMLSLFATVQYLGRWSEMTIGRGVIRVDHLSSERTKMVMVQIPVVRRGGGQTVGESGEAPAGPPPMMTVQRRAPADPEWKVSGSSDRPWYWAPVLRGDSTPAGNPASMVLPWWMLVLVGLVCGYGLLPPDVPAGMCRWCRFDLRKTPRLEDGKRVRCPECGRVSRVGPVE